MRIRLNELPIAAGIPDKPGVYRLYVPGTNLSYVGGSKRMKTRVYGHRCKMASGQCSHAFSAATELHGHDAFRSEVLELCNLDQLAEAEERWINQLKPTLNFYTGRDHVMNRNCIHKLPA